MSRGEEKAKEWQFSIRHLLTITALVAVASIEPRILAAFIYVLVLCLMGARYLPYRFFD
jgi:hypothetical protein